MGLVIAWAVTNLVSLGKAIDAILSENFRSIIAAENMVDALECQDSGILLMFLGDTGKGINQFRFAKVREGCINLRNLNEETMYAASVRAGNVARRAFWSTTLMRAGTAKSHSWPNGSGRTCICPCATMDREFPRNTNPGFFRNLSR